MVLLSERCLGTDGGENLFLASVNTILSTGAQGPTLRYGQHLTHAWTAIVGKSLCGDVTDHGVKD